MRIAESVFQFLYWHTIFGIPSGERFLVTLKFAPFPLRGIVFHKLLTLFM
jgi:hypothetical protein